MKSTGKCLSERYVLNGIIESRFCDAYAYIFDYCHYTYDFCIYLDTHIYYLLDFNISGFTC